MKYRTYFCIKRIVFTSIFTFLISICWGSYKHISFEVLNKDDGLNNNTIYSILQDRNDCMWFATDLGLSKYDGLFFHNFELPAVTSPVVRMYEFDDGIILAQTVTGWVFAFDYIKERQITIVCDDKNITDYPIRIAPSGGKTLYATGPTGLFDIKMEVDRGANVVVFKVTSIKGASENLMFAATDTSGRLFSYVKGTTKILCYDPKTQKIRHIDFGSCHSLDLDGSVDRMRAFDDNLWIGLKYDGLLCYDFKTDKVIKLSGGDAPRPLFSRNYNYVLGIDKLNDSTYFAATQKGAYRMKFKGAQVGNNFLLNMSPTSEPTFRNFIEANSMCVYADKKRNLVWVGTFGGGVIKHDLNNEFYGHIDLNSVTVNSMFEDQFGYLWLATSGSGILKSDSEKLTANTRFMPWENAQNDPTGRYVAYRDNTSGLIMFGSSGGTVIEYDNLTSQVKSFKLKSQKSNQSRVTINRVFVDSKLRRWIATSQGLFYRGPSDDNYRYSKIEMPPYGYGVSSIVEDTDGDIWIGTSKGVARLDCDNQNCVKIARNDYEKTLGTDHMQVYSMFINAKGQIVVGYVDRIHRINTIKDSMEYICSLSDNLPNGHITCMVDDRMGNTWFGTNAGIINIRSSGKHMFNYSAEGSIRSACRLSDGRLVWGGSNGLMFFYPAIAYNDPKPSKLILSALYMGRTQILPGVEYENGVKIENTLAQTNELKLPYSKSSVTLYFTDRQYTITPKRVSYILEPLMTHWESSPSHGGVNFQWLPAGHYTLRVKSLFHDETMGAESVFKIVITPPWYASWWMWIIYILVGLGLLLYCYLRVSKRVLALKEWYMSKILEVSDKRVMDLQDEGKEVVNVHDQTKSILIVCSDNKFVNILEPQLTPSYTIITAHKITDGLFAAIENVPSIIMCDVKVQGESGFDYYRKVKQNLNTCHIPLLMFGDAPATDTKIQNLTRENDVKTYLSKSQGVELFIETLTKMIDNRDVIRRSIVNYIGNHNDLENVTPPIDNGDHESDFVKELIEIIENNIAAPDFNVKRLAELSNMSQSTLYRRVMSSTQTSVVELIRDVRLNSAAKLLRENGKLSVQQVAEMVGYNDIATFRKHFNAMFGVTPSKYYK